MVESTRRYYLENPGWHKTLLAQRLREEYGVSISDRRVQQIIDTAISNRERALARGGASASDVLQRIRLIREAPYPHRAWIMDHCFLAQEYVDVDALSKAADFDFRSCVRMDDGPRSTRTYGLHLTRIIDAVAGRTRQRVDLEDLLEEGRPSAGGLPRRQVR
jgi:hypothetical protein